MLKIKGSLAPSCQKGVMFMFIYTKKKQIVNILRERLQSVLIEKCTDREETLYADIEENHQFKVVLYEFGFFGNMYPIGYFETKEEAQKLVDRLYLAFEKEQRCFLVQPEDYPGTSVQTSSNVEPKKKRKK